MSSKILNLSGNAALEGSNPRPPLDIPALMAEIRARVRAEIETSRDQEPSFSHTAADFNRSPRRAGEVLNSEELRFVNLNHTYPLRLNLDNISSHRPGVIGRVLVKAKRKLKALLWNQILRDYFEGEKEYQANLVRLLNDLVKYVDARDASNFWELIRKIDVDVTRALDRVERMADEQAAGTISSEKRVYEELNGVRRDLDRLSAQAQGHDAALATLQGVVGGLESIMARLGKSGVPSAAPSPGAASIDYSYLLLENRFRGAEAEIGKRLSIYPEVFRGATAPVLEIGAGRGELQQLFKQAGVPGYGVDLDAAMVEAARSKGMDVRLENGLEHLANVAPRSLGGVIAVQVVEHLSREQLNLLYSLCAEKVVQGGKVIFETINPRSVVALSSNYFRDPTHVWPLHPDTLAYGMQLAGLRIIETRFLSPIPPEAALGEIQLQDFMPPRWAGVIDALNVNLKRLNDLLFGYQDYCVVAEVP